MPDSQQAAAQSDLGQKFTDILLASFKQSPHPIVAMPHAPGWPECSAYQAEPHARKNEKTSLTHRQSRLRAGGVTRSLAGCAGSVGDGGERKPPRCLDETRQVTSIGAAWCLGHSVIRLPNYGPTNLTAQCKQQEKICQGGNASRSTKSCYVVFKPSTCSGLVSESHKA